MFKTDSERINAAVDAFRLHVGVAAGESRGRLQVRQRVGSLACYIAAAYIGHGKRDDATAESRAVAEIQALAALEALKVAHEAILAAGVTP